MENMEKTKNSDQNLRDKVLEELAESMIVFDEPTGPVNREQKRHGMKGKTGYKRPRKNKKLYEK